MSAPIPMLLWCPGRGTRHIDEGEFATKEHHTHACQHCGMVWRPAIVATCGVQFLPGFKNEPTASVALWAECQEPSLDRTPSCNWIGEMSQLDDRDGIKHCPNCGSTAIREDIVP